MKTAKILHAFFHPGALVLLAVASLLLAGCGDLNDSPYEGGLTVHVDFANVPQEASSDGGPEAQAISFTGTGEPVLSVVLGAIVITHTATPYNNTNIDSIEDAQRELLEQDAEQSVQFLEIIQLPHPEDSVSFPIPPSNAGPWQLVAIGLRHRITSLAEIQNNSPIYYGFIGQFLNDIVVPGQVLEQTLTMCPAMFIDEAPTGATPCP